MYTEFNIKDGKIYTKSNLCERIDIFEIVEKIPAGFFVWNIGENMGSNEYIPLAQDLHPEDKENYGDYAIYHISDDFTVDEQNRFRTLLNAWNNFDEVA